MSRPDLLETTEDFYEVITQAFDSRVVQDGDSEDVFVALFDRGFCLFKGVSGNRVGLGEHHYLSFLRKGRVKFLKLRANAVIGLEHVFVLERNAVEKDLGATDVTKEGVAQALPLGRALDEAGNIG